MDNIKKWFYIWRKYLKGKIWNGKCKKDDKSELILTDTCKDFEIWNKKGNVIYFRAIVLYWGKYLKGKNRKI